MVEKNRNLNEDASSTKAPMTKKLGIALLGTVFAIGMVGCGTQANGYQLPSKGDGQCDGEWQWDDDEASCRDSKGNSHFFYAGGYHSTPYRTSSFYKSGTSYGKKSGKTVMPKSGVSSGSKGSVSSGSKSSSGSKGSISSGSKGGVGSGTKGGAATGG